MLRTIMKNEKFSKIVVTKYLRFTKNEEVSLRRTTTFEYDADGYEISNSKKTEHFRHNSSLEEKRPDLVIENYETIEYEEFETGGKRRPKKVVLNLDGDRDTITIVMKSEYKPDYESKYLQDLRIDKYYRYDNENDLVPYMDRITHYDKNGNVIKITTKDSKTGNSKNVEMMFYDLYNNLVFNESSSDNNIRRSFYEYDDKNRLIYEKVAASSTLNDANNTKEYKMFYDSINGNILFIEKYRNNAFSGIIKYEYNESDHSIIETEYDLDKSINSMRKITQTTYYRFPVNDNNENIHQGESDHPNI